MQAPSQQPVKIGAVDVEEFSRNLARLVEQGGRALAAYLKPREQGRDDREFADEVTEVVKTLGHVAEYWLADPQRTVELQSRLGKAYLDLWAAAARRLAGEEAAPVAAPAPNDRRFADPEWSSNQFYDFLKQAYLLTARWANQLVSRRRRSRSAHQAKGRVLHAADRQRAVAVELRPDQSGIAARNLHQQRRESGARHAHAGGGRRSRRRPFAHPPVGFLDVRGRAQSGDDARQGDLSERSDAAHPVCAVDRDGAQAPASDRAAVDQQVLRSRSHAGKILHQMVRRSGAYRLLHLLGQPGCAPRAKDLRRLRARGPARRARRHQAGNRRGQGARRRLLRRRHHARGGACGHGGREATSASCPRRCSPRRSISPMRAI